MKSLNTISKQSNKTKMNLEQSQEKLILYINSILVNINGFSLEVNNLTEKAKIAAGVWDSKYSETVNKCDNCEDTSTLTNDAKFRGPGLK